VEHGTRPRPAWRRRSRLRDVPGPFLGVQAGECGERRQFTALHYFALDGTDHASHEEQVSMIRRYIIWRNKHAADKHLRQVVARANVA
jgi:hypothetical protein